MVDANKIKQSHILGIDVVRFIAALMVVWFHFGYLMGRNPMGVAGTASRHLVAFPELYSWSFFGWVGVEIFFVISGFVIAFSAEKATAFTFFVSRVVRLVPGVWICSTITLLTVLALGIYDRTELFRAYRHSMAFMIRGPWVDAAFWTLVIEISFYCCVGALILARQFKSIGVLAILIGSCSTVYLLARAFAQAYVGLGAIEDILKKYEHYADLFLLHHGVYFALGVLIWIHLFKSAGRANTLWMIVFAAAGCLEIAVQASSGNLMSANRNTLVICVIWCIGVIGIIQSVRLNSTLHRCPQWFLHALKSAGLMTFPLYLVHTVAGATIMGRLVLAGFSRWTALVAGLVIVLSLVFLVSKYLEPALQRVAKRLLYRLHEQWLMFWSGRSKSAQ